MQHGRTYGVQLYNSAVKTRRTADSRERRDKDRIEGRGVDVTYTSYQNCSLNYNTFWMVSENPAAIFK